MPMFLIFCDEVQLKAYLLCNWYSALIWPRLAIRAIPSKRYSLSLLMALSIMLPATVFKVLAESSRCIYLVWNLDIPVC